MDLLDSVRQKFNNKLQVLYQALETARVAQRDAPSAMESASNTTRSEMEKMVTALEIEIANLKEKILLIPTKLSEKEILWSVKEIKNMKVLIVPEGIGVEIVDGVRLVSENAPIVKSLKI